MKPQGLEVDSLRSIKNVGGNSPDANPSGIDGSPLAAFGMEIEAIFDSNLLFRARVLPDRAQFDKISELTYYNFCTLSTQYLPSIS